MSNPAQPTERKRFARVTYNGEEYRAAGGTMQVLSKPGLVGWAAEQVGLYVRDTLEKARAGKWKFSEIMDVLGKPEHLREIPQGSRSSRMDVARVIHDYVQASADNIELPADAFGELTRPYIEAYRKWFQESGYKWEALRCFAYNTEHGYCVEFDGILTNVAGQNIVVDFTISPRAYAESYLKLAAAMHADFIAIDENNQVEMPGTDQAMTLVISPDGCKEFYWNSDPTPLDQAWRSFLSLQSVAEWLDSKPEPIDASTQRQLL
jgi:hypothetical protein